MISFDEALVRRIDMFIESLFVPGDPILAANIANANAAGLPPINVTPNQGKFLYLLARIAGARRVLEIGTLGGYSTTWLGRALPADGRLITLEYRQVHAETARRNLAAAGLDGIVEVRVGDAAASLSAMIAAGEPPFDFVFVDADKTGYVKYLDLALQLSRPGTVIVADNIIRNGEVMEDSPENPNARGAQAYNAAVASHPRLESIALPMFKNKIDGIAISRVK
ncbi:MAG: O-methyltransferase [Bryobacteraceae bacterium]|jgi:predicted O-methyltransferase YrrM